ncbi:MAG: ABC transporter ATP-binding protein [Phycisphaerales bacterium]|nr:MAG: ABC transporter ATP-binding protein [Phycisphaerales bacterium]
MPVSLCAESIKKHFPTRSGELAVLRDVSLTLDAGESAAIMGPSGSGKSTLLNILGTLDTPTAGTVTIDGKNPFELDERELARFRNQRIGFVFQDQHLLPQCCVLENVLLATLVTRGGNDATERARRLLDRVGLSDRLKHLPAELSGGERQRVAIARALINNPTLVLADEPTGNLDQTTADSIASLLSEVHRDENVTLLVVTHSRPLAERFERRFDVADGTLVELEGA